MPKDYGRRIPYDPRMIREIQSSSSMRAEQGDGFMGSWGKGGPYAYQYWAQQPEDERVVYFALDEGWSKEDLPEATGLSVARVNKAHANLVRKGTLKLEPVEPAAA